MPSQLRSSLTHCVRSSVLQWKGIPLLLPEFTMMVRAPACIASLKGSKCFSRSSEAAIEDGDVAYANKTLEEAGWVDSDGDGIREKNGILMPDSSCMTKLANKHMHFLHPNTEFKIANKCCQYMKKYPFEDFAKENDMRGYYSGVRVAEGGVRSKVYKSCVDITIKKGQEFYKSMPIIDWTDEMVDKFIEKYNIEISEAYTKYGCTRTGCSACPFSKNIKHDLKVLWDYEPLKYKAMMKWLKDVYMYQEIECDWDEEYMEEYNRMKPVIEQRRKEMMEKFRPKN